jgi:hypothetical protein
MTCRCAKKQVENTTCEGEGRLFLKLGVKVEELMTRTFKEQACHLLAVPGEISILDI